MIAFRSTREPAGARCIVATESAARSVLMKWTQLIGLPTELSTLLMSFMRADMHMPCVGLSRMRWQLGYAVGAPTLLCVGRQQPFADRYQRRLGAGPKVQLSKKVADVCSRSPLADVKFPCDFLV